MKKYKHLFFDLDRTLWDFDNNTSLTLNEIVEHFNLSEVIEDNDRFIQKYHRYNDYVWELYRNNKIKKQTLRTERFRLLLADYHISDQNLIQSINEYYISHSPKKPLVIQSALQVLEYLHVKYNLYIISNGFYEIQELKLVSSKMRPFFLKIFTSDKIGVSKPDKLFFAYAIKSANARKSESLIIGDDLENDIAGAKNFGIDQVWVNTKSQKAITSFHPTFEIHQLDELFQIL